MKTSAIAAALLCLFAQTAQGDNSSDALFQKGATLYDEGNFEEAKQILSPLADQGDTRAFFVFGLMHEFGKGVAADTTKALGFYEKAAKNVPGAMNQLGLMYLEGTAVTSDKKKAWDLFKRAASLGNENSAFNAARAMYWAPPELFTEELLADALKFAEQARLSGLADAEVFENTLTCAVKPPRKASNDISIRESLSHYEVTGAVKTIVDTSFPSNGTLYFGKGGHLLRDRTQIGDWHFFYDAQCRLIATEWFDEKNGKRRFVGKRTTTYNGQEVATFRQEGVFPVDLRYRHYDQRDGGRVTKTEQVGQTYPTTSFQKFDANGRLAWDTNGAQKPSPWSIILPIAPYSGGVPRPNGNPDDMELGGGNHFLYSPEGRLATIIDNNGTPSGTYRMRVDYRYRKEGWAASEQVSAPGSSEPSWSRAYVWSVVFDNYKGDKRGNWISRNAKYRFVANDINRNADDEQSRQITYYSDAAPAVARKK